jgi:hypothetical protein
MDKKIFSIGGQRATKMETLSSDSTQTYDVDVRTREVFQQKLTIWRNGDGTDLRESFTVPKPVNNGFTERKCKFCVVQLERMHVRKYRKTTRQLLDDVFGTMVTYHNVDDAGHSKSQ